MTASILTASLSRARAQIRTKKDTASISNLGRCVQCPYTDLNCSLSLKYEGVGVIDRRTEYFSPVSPRPQGKRNGYENRGACEEKIPPQEGEDFVSFQNLKRAKSSVTRRKRSRDPARHTVETIDPQNSLPFRGGNATGDSGA